MNGMILSEKEYAARLAEVHNEIDARQVEAEAQREAMRARRLEREAAIDAQREAEAAAKRQAHEERIEARLKERGLASWLKAGGKPEEFEARWPKLRDAVLEADMLAALPREPKRPVMRL